MGKIIRFLPFIAAIAITFFIGCDNDPNIKRDFHLPNSAAVISAFNASKPESEWAKKTVGKVTINVSDTIIHIKNDIDNNPVLTIYFLQIEDPVQGFDSMDLGLSEILFLDTHLIVNSLVRNETFLFSLQNEPVPPYLEGIFFTHKIRGYGIGQHTINRNVN